MKFDVEVISPVERILHIEIPKIIVEESFNEAYSEIRRTSKIKGFRPGKTPRSVLEQLYGKDVRKNISSQLVQKGLSEVLSKSKLKFAGTKKINSHELSPDKAYKFDIEIEIKPEIGKIEFKGLKLKKTLYKPNKKEVSTQLSMLQKKLSTSESIIEDRKIIDKDLVTLNCEIFKESGNKEKVDTLKNFILKIGESNISKDFDEKIKGMKKNEEKEFTLTFPDKYHNKNLASLKTRIKVKIKDIKIEILPEINDKMAQTLGPFNSLTDLKDRIFKNLEQGYEKRKQQEINEQIFTELIKKTTFELPKIMVQQELDSIIEEAEKSFEFHNKSLEEVGLSRKNLSEQYREIAEKQVRRQLILDQIIEQEEMKISDKQLENGFKEISLIYNTSIDKIKTFYGQNPEKLNLFKHTLLEKRAIDIIIGEGLVEEVKPELLKNNKEN